MRIYTYSKETIPPFTPPYKVGITVIPREFSEGDLVLVRTARTESRGKMEPKWEGPFIVKATASPSAYRLATPNDEDLEHSWNIDNLRKFFV
jgi:hypothetical protein